MSSTTNAHAHALALIDRVRRTACARRTNVARFFSDLSWKPTITDGSNAPPFSAVHTDNTSVPRAEVTLSDDGDTVREIVLRLSPEPGFGIRELETVFGPMNEGSKHHWNQPDSWWVHLDDPVRKEFCTVVVTCGTGDASSVVQTITISPYDRLVATTG